MENLKKTVRKRKDHLHVPYEYVPLCKNFHPEKEMLRSRLKTKSIDHGSKFLFSKLEFFETPKISSKIMSLDIINKKKTREMVSTYSLNSKMKLQRKLKVNQEEWQKKEHERNSLTLGINPLYYEENTNLQNEQENEKGTPKETFQNFQSPKFSSKGGILSPKTLISGNSQKNKKPMDFLIKKLENSKKQQDKKVEMIEKDEKTEKVRLIERTGLKIFGQDKFNQGKLKQMFKIATNKEVMPEPKKKKKKKRKKQLSLFSQHAPKEGDDNIFKQKEKDSSYFKENYKTETISIWKYNSITDDYEFNEDDEINFSKTLFNEENIKKYRNMKKQETYGLAQQRLDFYRKSFEENQKQIQRNKIFIKKLSSKILADDITNFEENDFNYNGDNEAVESEDNLEYRDEHKISDFDEGKRNSLPILIKKDKSTEVKNNRILNSVHKSISSQQNNDDKTQENHYFLKLAETIEGVCKQEHQNHRKILRKFKSDNKLFQTSLRKMKNVFEKFG